MFFMQWTPAMSVGVPELDDDHKVLIRIINQLAENVDGPVRPAMLRRCVYALMRYAEYHFGREEEVMRSCGFPELPAHRDEHRRFIETIRVAAQRFEQAEAAATGGEVTTATPGQYDESTNRELLEFLKHWLTHHILKIDMAYRPFVENRPEARKAAKMFKAAEVWWSQ